MVFLLTPTWDPEFPFSPTCQPQAVGVLMAQAVPDATAVLRVDALPTGLSFAAVTARNGEARFWLDSDRAGVRAVTVRFTVDCDTSGARSVPSDEARIDRFDASSGGAERFYRLPGGCVTYDYSASALADPELVAAVEEVLGFLARSELVAYVQEESGQPLCGAGATCLATA